jgi:hypothetical protein
MAPRRQLNKLKRQRQQWVTANTHHGHAAAYIGKTHPLRMFIACVEWSGYPSISNESQNHFFCDIAMDLRQFFRFLLCVCAVCSPEKNFSSFLRRI